LKHHMTSLLSIFLLLSLSIAKHVLLSKYYSIILPWIVYICQYFSGSLGVPLNVWLYYLIIYFHGLYMPTLLSS
jgi:hypothetical protein